MEMFIFNEQIRIEDLKVAPLYDSSSGLCLELPLPLDPLGTAYTLNIYQLYLFFMIEASGVLNSQFSRQFPQRKFV